MKAKEASELVPFDAVMDDYCVTSYGDLLFAFKVRQKEVYTMSADSDEVKGFYHSWKNALMNLGEGNMVQKISFFNRMNLDRMEDNGCITKGWNEDMFLKREIMEEETYMLVYINYKEGRSSGSLFNRVKSFSGIEEIEKYKRKVSSIRSGLRRVFESVEDLSGDQVLDLYERTWNVGQRKDQLGDVENENGVFKVGGNHVKVLTSRKLPTYINGFSENNNEVTESSDLLGGNKTDYRSGQKMACSFLFPLGMGFPDNHILVETICIEPKDRVESELNGEKKSLNVLKAISNSEATTKQKTIEKFIALKGEHGYTYAKWGVTVILRGKNQQDVTKLADVMMNISQDKMSMTLADENYGAWRAFFSCMPGGGRQANNLRLDYLEVLSYMTHVESFKQGNSSGVVISDLFGKRFLFDFWDEKSKYVKARNGVLFAPTGEGKSFLVNLFLDQCYWAGDYVFLVDVGASYKRITELNNGTYIDSSNINDLCFNPFLDCFYSKGKYYPELSEDKEFNGVFIDFIVNLVSACLYKEQVPSSTQKIALGVTVRNYYKYVNLRLSASEDVIVGFNDYYDYVTKEMLSDIGEDKETIEEYFDPLLFKTIMSDFTMNGKYPNLLNRKEKLVVDTRWLTFDLIGIVQGHQGISSIVLLMIMNLFERVMWSLDGARGRLFIDEAIDFLKGGDFADYIGALYRKIRKAGGQVFIATQDVSFLDHVDPLLKSSILSNSSIKILLDHKSVDNLFPKIQKELSLSKSEVELLKNQTVTGAPFRIGFMRFGNMPGFLFRIEVSPETFTLYQTDKDKKKFVDACIAEYGTIGGVRTVIEENNKLIN